MGQPDLRTKDYFNNAARFADLFNGALFSGEQMIHPEELTELDSQLITETDFSMEPDQKQHKYQQVSQLELLQPDNARLCQGSILALFLLDNQDYVDYRMPIREMLTEARAYQQQWQKLRSEHEAKKDLKGSDEFLSKMKSSEKLIPVITLVVYYNPVHPWDGSRTLFELLDMNGREQLLAPLINNYRMNLFDFHDLTDFGRFRTSLRQLFEYLRYSTDKEALRKRLYADPAYQALDSDTARLLAQYTDIYYSAIGCKKQWQNRKSCSRISFKRGL